MLYGEKERGLEIIAIKLTVCLHIFQMVAAAESLYGCELRAANGVDLARGCTIRRTEVTTILLTNNHTAQLMMMIIIIIKA